MSTNQIRALLIEDDPDDILLLKDSLAEIGLGKIRLDYADRLSKGLIQLGLHVYDVVLLDLNLPDSRGLDTLNTTIKRFPKLPVVVLSGLADDVITVEAVRRGAQDYLVKGDISGPLVMRVVRYAIERKQVEAVLRASEARYRTLVETSPNGITLADLEGKLLLCNPQAARLHSYASPEAMVGVNFFKLIAPHDRHPAAANIRKTLNEGRVTNGEYTMLRRDGSPFPAEISTAVQCNTSGAPVGFICITRDITERKKVIDAEKQVVMLEKEFLSKEAGELRAPILSVMECLNLLGSGKITGGDGQEMVLRRGVKDVNSLLDMVDELLDFSLLESERLILKREQVDLGKVISEVLGAFKEQAIARRVSLLAGSMEVPLLVTADAARMRRVLVRLVQNAINFSDKDGTVLVTAKAMKGKILINVIDEGSGITVEDSERILEKYYQVEHPLNQNTFGMGLGLYTAKQIVEAHGGTLTVSSQLGAGSTFGISIPVEEN
jgi:two-component system cell cycle sensor histidine kinase/response regulator CckA